MISHLKILAKITAQTRAKPYSAPALVDCTRWETPTAAAAIINPGPSAYFNVENREELSVAIILISETLNFVRVQIFLSICKS